MTAAAMPVAVREPAVVAVDGLHKAWGRGAARRPALVDVRLWAAGGVVAVLGPNGAGKTTLLRCLATLVAPDRGTVHVDGLDVGVPDQRQDVRSRLGYVPQRPAFSAGSRAFDVVDVLAACKGLGPDRTRRGASWEALVAVGLADRAGDKVRTLSGGMVRRLAVAQALVGHPTLLVLDEPAADLDPEQRVHLRHLLGARAGTTTTIVSTHLLDEAAAVGDVLGVLDQGRVAWTGAPAALTATATGRVWWAEQPPAGGPDLRLAWRTPSGWWRCLGRPPAGAALAEPTLEDAYLLLVGPAGHA